MQLTNMKMGSKIQSEIPPPGQAGLLRAGLIAFPLLVSLFFLAMPSSRVPTYLIATAEITPSPLRWAHTSDMHLFNVTGAIRVGSQLYKLARFHEDD